MKNNKACSSNHVVAAFDFDGTLITRDSLVPFLIYLQGVFKTYSKLLLLSPYGLGFGLNLISRQQVKERVLKSFIKGMSFSDLLHLGERFANGVLDRFVCQELFKRYQWHKSQGHICILVSASLDFYLTPWAQRHGFHHVISSKLEIDNQGKVTGNLLGKNCWGPEKPKQLIELIGPKDQYTLYAYGDSRGDYELLQLADYSFYKK